MSSKDLTDALHSIMRTMAGDGAVSDNSMDAAKARGAKSRVTSAGVDSPMQTAPSGGSLTGDLTETAYTDRQYFDAVTLSSTDGLIQWEIQPIKLVKFVDADGNPFSIAYKAPV